MTPTVEGAYDTGASGYQPPAPYPTWEALVQDQDTQLQLVDRLQIMG
ncbi:hypothetical protein [Lamprobacter modestohalophilus]|nr:hypothetical protein [Lamprobacter modestohalophilus]